VDGISDMAECGRGLLVVVYMSRFFMYRIEFGWAGLCRGVGRGYTGVALKGLHQWTKPHYSYFPGLDTSKRYSLMYS
jgi:hypothetical protein